MVNLKYVKHPECTCAQSEPLFIPSVLKTFRVPHLKQRTERAEEQTFISSVTEMFCSVAQFSIQSHEYLIDFVL